MSDTKVDIAKILGGADSKEVEPKEGLAKEALASDLMNAAKGGDAKALVKSFEALIKACNA